MLLAAALSTLLLAGSGVPAATPETAIASNPDRTRVLSALPASDEDIKRSLFEMLEREPERVVCSVRVHTGSRQPRTSCATLQAWFANRRAGEIANNDAPWQLVEEIKERRKKAMMRAKGGR